MFNIGQMTEVLSAKVFVGGVEVGNNAGIAALLCFALGLLFSFLSKASMKRSTAGEAAALITDKEPHTTWITWACAWVAAGSFLCCLLLAAASFGVLAPY